MTGYLNNPAATAEAFTNDNWIRTGDIGYTKDKNWYVVDRAKDLIKLFLANRLARYKNVEEICFVDKIPRNSIRKILRRVLRDM